MSTPKSQAPLAANSGEKTIDGDGSATQWVASIPTPPNEFVISISGEDCFRGNFVLLERRLRPVSDATVVLLLAGFSSKSIT
jgi:hypothetical protein